MARFTKAAVLGLVAAVTAAGTGCGMMDRWRGEDEHTTELRRDGSAAIPPAGPDMRPAGGVAPAGIGGAGIFSEGERRP